MLKKTGLLILLLLVFCAGYSLGTHSPLGQKAGLEAMPDLVPPAHAATTEVDCSEILKVVRCRSITGTQKGTFFVDALPGYSLQLDGQDAQYTSFGAFWHKR